VIDVLVSGHPTFDQGVSCNGRILQTHTVFAYFKFQTFTQA